MAGATGAIGTPLVTLLLAAGHDVFAMTRDAVKARALDARGAHGIVADAYDAAGLVAALAAIRPSVVIHQLTDLSGMAVPEAAAATLARNARLRVEGTRNLMIAALRSGATRTIAQSILWTYAPGREPHREGDPLEAGAAGTRGLTVDGVIALERTVSTTAGVTGIIVRYGRLYGPGTGRDDPPAEAPVHVDAAASAARLAIDHGAAGIYNVAEPNGYADTSKARRELLWDANFRLDPSAT